MYYRHSSDSRGHSPQNALFQLRRQGGAAVGARYRRAVEGLRIEEQARRALVPRPKTGTASIQPNCRCSPTRNGASNIGRAPKPGISSARSSASPRSVSGVRCGAQLTRVRVLKSTSFACRTRPGGAGLQHVPRSRGPAWDCSENPARRFTTPAMVVIAPGRPPTSEAMGYRSPYTANRDTAAQINTHSPSESSSTKISASPGLSLRVGSLPEYVDDEGSCESRQEAKDQTRWNAAFLSNWSSQLRKKTAYSSPSPRHLLGVTSSRYAAFWGMQRA